jgi:uncharacterized protein (TIRG00374 family)
VLAFILSRISIPEALSHILSVNKAYFILSALLSFPFFFLKALRWKYLMNRQGIGISAKLASSRYFSALYMGLITPARVGELTKVMYIKRSGHSFGKALFSVFFDRLFDIIALGGFTLIGLLWFSGVLGFDTSYLIAVISLSLLLLFLLLWRKNLFRKVLIALFTLLMPRNLRIRAKDSFRDFLSDLGILNARTIIITAAFTLASIAVYYLQAYLLALALGISISSFYLAFAVSLATFAAILPVSVLGIGTRDAALLYMLAYAGISAELTIAYSALVLVNILILALFSSFFWFTNPVPLTK